jgi:serine/threonine protein kinase
MEVQTVEKNQSSYSFSQLQELIAAYLGPDNVPKRFKVITDTSDFFRVDYNDVVILGNVPYLMRNYTKEGRFGLDDEPKYWVRKAVNLTNREIKIIKLVFHEEIDAHVGDIVFKCMRSPSKEAAILDMVTGHKNFMQGKSFRDTAGNIVRVLDFIRGKRLDELIADQAADHEKFFYKYLPAYLDIYAELVRAIQFIHERGQKHGDIRRDHILLDRETGNYRWIDFDYDYYHEANMFGYDLFGLGNILVYLVGGGDITAQNLQARKSPLLGKLYLEDMNIIFNNRVANIQKIYPYIPDSLNYILLHFSNGANLYYENTEQLLEDLEEVQITH